MQAIIEALGLLGIMGAGFGTLSLICCAVKPRRSGRGYKAHGK